MRFSPLPMASFRPQGLHLTHSAASFSLVNTCSRRKGRALLQMYIARWCTRTPTIASHTIFTCRVGPGWKQTGSGFHRLSSRLQTNAVLSCEQETKLPPRFQLMLDTSCLCCCNVTVRDSVFSPLTSSYRCISLLFGQTARMVHPEFQP